MQSIQKAQKAVHFQVPEHAQRDCLGTAHATEPTVPFSGWYFSQQAVAIFLGYAGGHKYVGFSRMRQENGRSTVTHIGMFKDLRTVPEILLVISPEAGDHRFAVTGHIRRFLLVRLACNLVRRLTVTLHRDQYGQITRSRQN